MTDATTPRQSELRSRLAGPAGEWVAEARAAAGDHPEVDELIAYHTGELAEADERRIQDHLVTCRDCLEHLLELDAFTGSGTESGPEGRTGGAAEAAAGAGAADFETAAAWRALRSRLPAGPSRVPRRAAVLAASLAVAVVGLAVVALDQRREVGELSRRVAELSQPQPGAAIVDLYPASALRSEGAPREAFELPAAGYTTLILNLPQNLTESAGSDRYSVEILDAGGGLLWSGGALEPTRFGTLRLGLPGGFLPAGGHSLRLYRLDGEQRRPVESYPIRVPAP